MRSAFIILLFSLLCVYSMAQTVIEAGPGTEIVIENSRQLTVRTWNEASVKVEGNFTAGSFSIKREATVVKVQNKDTVILYVPVGSPIRAVNTFGQLTIENPVKELSIENKNGTVKLATVKNLFLNSNGGSFTADSIANGDLRFSYTRINLVLLRNGIWNSKYTTTEISEMGEVKLTSNNDEMEIGRVVHIAGIKNFGSLRIDFLVRKLELEGTNADIYIKDMNPRAELVKINSHNGDLRLPLTKLSTYSVDIRGGHNNLYGSFANQLTKQNLSSKETATLKMTGAFAKADVSKLVKYSAQEGEGVQPRIEIICMFSTINFR